MQRFNFTLLAVFLFAFTFVIGQGITPTAPGPQDKFSAGSACTIEWKVGQGWSNFSIDLMSGSNVQMNKITTVAHGLDGSNASLSPFNWTCPEVNPYSAIYFYQFTNFPASANSTWTTRFTIASPSGDSVAPANPTQPNGDPIPWGTGSLASASTSMTASSTTFTASSSESSSSRMQRVKTASTARQATPTLNLPSSSSTAVATQAPGIGAASRPGNDAKALKIKARSFGVWAISALVLVSS